MTDQPQRLDAHPDRVLQAQPSIERRDAVNEQGATQRVEAALRRHKPDGCTQLDKSVLVYIAHRGECYASVETIATELWCKARAIQYALKRLKNAGLIRLVRQGNRDLREANTYAFVEDPREPVHLMHPHGASNAPPPQDVVPTTPDVGVPVHLMHPNRDYYNNTSPAHAREESEQEHDVTPNGTPVDMPDGSTQWLLPDDWQPPEHAYARIRMSGVPEDFARDQARLFDFLSHYTEAPQRQPNWTRKFVQWVVNDWRNHHDRTREHHGSARQLSTADRAAAEYLDRRSRRQAAGSD